MFKGIVEKLTKTQEEMTEILERVISQNQDMEDLSEELLGERLSDEIMSQVIEQEFTKVIELLKNDNYTKQIDQLESFPEHRHYQKLVKNDCIAAVEIHKELVIDKYRNEFNYKVIFDDIQLVNNISVLSFENQLILSIIAIQINDYGFKLKKFSLRNAYDVFLLSKKVIGTKGN